MRILVTGASGFVGQHLVPQLLAQGHHVTALGRSGAHHQAMPWAEQVPFVAYDILSQAPLPQSVLESPPDVMVHLAWAGLPNFKGDFHLTENLPSDLLFLTRLVEAGCPHLLVTGTCLEYGLQSGELSESLPTQPTTAYGQAKDQLRQALQALQHHQSFVLQWARLFYMWGPGQAPNSLLPQLDRALAQGDVQFNMSGGEQVRDYLHIEEVARRLAALVAHPECTGVVNCGSGVGVKLKDFVADYLAARDAHMSLNLGHYPYPDYEPMAFWADAGRINALLSV